ncbi:hypothetical protein HPB51_005067 [Rhipicephalus microplus]|uniref:Deoxyribonuclease TATDN1 n=1 Tax=Rhipicephalus microplus TaxID=6941 RepID=A0A9J6DLJ5_RHIMP|nr:hypothetical protein HPB51_005067 [Rhipicephalus microplus]
MASNADQLFVSDDNYLLVDICANLVNKKFNRDLESVIQRAKDAGVRKMIVLGTSLHSTKEALRLTRMHPGTVYCAAGIHPHDAKSWDDDEALEVLRSVASNPECVAIGECGLDFSKDFSSPECQIQVLEKQAGLFIFFFFHKWPGRMIGSSDEESIEDSVNRNANDPAVGADVADGFCDDK